MRGCVEHGEQVGAQDRVVARRLGEVRFQAQGVEILVGGESFGQERIARGARMDQAEDAPEAEWETYSAAEDAQIEQGADGGAGVQIARAIGQIFVREQNLGGTDAVSAEGLLVRLC